MKVNVTIDDKLEKRLASVMSKMPLCYSGLTIEEQLRAFFKTGLDAVENELGGKR